MRRRWRAFNSWLWHGALPCVTCGRPRVGFAIYCREHTDAILNRLEEIGNGWSPSVPIDVEKMLRDA